MSDYAAVDLGASGGRVMVGRVGTGTLNLTEVHRFANVPVRVPGRCTGTSSAFIGAFSTD
jgi:rhamnulokinase